MIPGSLRRWWPLAAVVLLLALTAVAAAHSSPRIGRLPTPRAVTTAPQFQPPVTEKTEEPAEIIQAAPTELPRRLVVGALVLLGAMVAVLVGVMVWTLAREITLRRGGGRMPSRAARAEVVIAALDAGLVDLSDADLDPRRAVIACWVRLEQAAAGTPRQGTDTPTDLVTRLLEEHHVTADVLATLADVYRQARYATHTVDQRMREQARAALHSLRAELT